MPKERNDGVQYPFHPNLATGIKVDYFGVYPNSTNPRRMAYNQIISRIMDSNFGKKQIEIYGENQVKLEKAKSELGLWLRPGDKDRSLEVPVKELVRDIINAKKGAGKAISELHVQVIKKGVWPISDGLREAQYDKALFEGTREYEHAEILSAGTIARELIATNEFIRADIASTTINDYISESEKNPNEMIMEEATAVAGLFGYMSENSQSLESINIDIDVLRTLLQSTAFLPREKFAQIFPKILKFAKNMPDDITATYINQFTQEQLQDPKIIKEIAEKHGLYVIEPQHTSLIPSFIADTNFLNGQNINPTVKKLITFSQIMINTYAGKIIYADGFSNANDNELEERYLQLLENFYDPISYKTLYQGTKRAGSRIDDIVRRMWQSEPTIDDETKRKRFFFKQIDFPFNTGNFQTMIGFISYIDDAFINNLPDALTPTIKTIRDSVSNSVKNSTDYENGKGYVTYTFEEKIQESQKMLDIAIAMANAIADHLGITDKVAIKHF